MTATLGNCTTCARLDVPLQDARCEVCRGVKAPRELMPPFIDPAFLPARRGPRDPIVDRLGPPDEVVTCLSCGREVKPKAVENKRNVIAGWVNHLMAGVSGWTCGRCANRISSEGQMDDYLARLRISNSSSRKKVPA